MIKNAEHWLALYHAPGLGPAAACALIGHYGSAQAACTASTAEMRSRNLSAEAAHFLHTPDGDHFKEDLRWLKQEGHTLVGWGDARYPQRLAEIKDAPLLLFVAGDVELLNTPQLTIVGTRCPTPGGLENARRLAGSLARSGFTIVSGLASGIDTAAHEAALDADAPTIAVIGTGPDIIYPAKNKALAHRIVGHGAVASEFSCGTPPHAANFPRRNRVMSGLSLGVVVVEAAEKSGTMITARCAGEQGREVFAVPGSIRNPVARGCHRLIQQGAKLVQSAEDVLIEIVPQAGLIPPPATDGEISGEVPSGDISGGLDAEHHRLLECMGYDEPLNVDTLVKRSELTAAEVSSMLLIMELDGHVICESHLYTRAK